MVKFEKPRRCPKCHVLGNRNKTSIVYLYAKVDRTNNISNEHNKVGFICSNCGYFEIKYKGKKVEAI